MALHPKSLRTWLFFLLQAAPILSHLISLNSGVVKGVTMKNKQSYCSRNSKNLEDFLFLLFFFKVYLFFFERNRVSGGEGEREGERENPKQALHCQHRAQCGA